MGAGENVGPTPSQTEEMRSRLKSHIAENGSGEFRRETKIMLEDLSRRDTIADLFDQRDVDRFNSSQVYVDRFFKHVDSVASSPDEQLDLAMTMVINTLKFRKEMRIAGEMSV